MKCVHCGNELMPGSKFCTNCGTPVSEPVTLSHLPIPALLRIQWAIGPPLILLRRRKTAPLTALQRKFPPQADQIRPRRSPRLFIKRVSPKIVSLPPAPRRRKHPLNVGIFQALCLLPVTRHKRRECPPPLMARPAARRPLIPKITPGTFLPLIPRAITAAPRLFTQISPTTLSLDILRVLRRLKNPASLF